jgi:hypothetical protein
MLSLVKRDNIMVDRNLNLESSGGLKCSFYFFPQAKPSREGIMAQTPSTPIEARTNPDGRMDMKCALTYTGRSEKPLAMIRGNASGPKLDTGGRIFNLPADFSEWMNAHRRLSSTTEHKQRLFGGVRRCLSPLGWAGKSNIPWPLNLKSTSVSE